MIKRACLVWALVCVGLAQSVYAAELVENATVSKVTSTDSNTTTFATYVVGGNGVCSGGAWISFPLAAAADVETHKRAYIALMTALLSGMKVRIHNYSNNACTNASYVEVYL